MPFIPDLLCAINPTLRLVVGSAYYVAPEVLKRNYGKEIVWSAVVILYILLSGVPPFWADTKKDIFDEILKGHIDFESSPWRSISTISTGAKDIIRKIFKSRITAALPLRHTNYQ